MYNFFRNTKCKNLFILIVLLFGVVSNNAIGQVTIGGSLEPLEGALLDLKQDGVTTKGLGMPRVALSNVNQLIMGDKVIENTDNAYDKHIGLAVYNVTANRVFCPGIYVWNGEEWESLQTKSNPSDITVADIDGNTYTAKWFTKDPCNPATGKYWTTSNMYATKSADGSLLPPAPSPHTGFARLNPAYKGEANSPIPTATIVNSRADLETGATISYQEGSLETSLSTISLTRLNFAKKFGLLYTHEQAAKVCPAGWHLPTDADWIDLLKALDEDGEISLNPPHSSGNNDVGQKIRSSSYWYKSVDKEPVFWGEKDDANVVRSGFNAYPVGDIEGYIAGTNAVNFSSDTYWWSASFSPGGNPYSWYIILDDKALHRVDWFLNSYYFSVRCVK